MKPFPNDRAALKYAAHAGLRVTEHIGTSRGTRINVVATEDTKVGRYGDRDAQTFVAGRPYTLCVVAPEPVAQELWSATYEVTETAPVNPNGPFAGLSA